VVVLLVAVVFQGFATHTVGASSEGAAASSAPLAHDRPVLAPQGSQLVPVEPPPGRRVALTFDDGPNPHWTIPIANALHAAGVPGTFFEIGSQVARYPEIVRRLVGYGDEIGNHTFTHVPLSAVPVWERQLQIDWTEAVIAGVTGHYTRLMRPPYSATPTALTRHEEQVLAQVLRGRYYVVLADYDSRDWQRPGVATIVHNADPPGATGGIVMMHDGGGNRSQTVTAVRELVPMLRARGFQFVTVSQLAGVATGLAEPAARGWVQTRGAAFVTGVRVAYTLTTLTAAVLIVIAAFVVLRALLLFGFATYHAGVTRQHHGAPSALRNDDLPSTVIVVPAYNEEVNIERTIRSLAVSDYPKSKFEVVVVDDGSSDHTADVVARLGLENVRLVRQHNAGKAPALQKGIDLSDAELVAMVDADTRCDRRLPQGCSRAGRRRPT
jgi:peptidoglycan/xylan/chitin deacetylase (PgdA/CDA1 family)